MSRSPGEVAHLSWWTACTPVTPCSSRRPTGETLGVHVHHLSPRCLQPLTHETGDAQLHRQSCWPPHYSVACALMAASSTSEQGKKSHNPIDGLYAKGPQVKFFVILLLVFTPSQQNVNYVYTGIPNFVINSIFKTKKKSTQNRSKI